MYLSFRNVPRMIHMPCFDIVTMQIKDITMITQHAEYKMVTWILIILKSPEITGATASHYSPGFNQPDLIGFSYILFQFLLSTTFGNKKELFVGPQNPLKCDGNKILRRIKDWNLSHTDRTETRPTTNQTKIFHYLCAYNNRSVWIRS